MNNQLPDNQHSHNGMPHSPPGTRTRSSTRQDNLPKRLVVEIEPLPPLKATRYRIAVEDFSVKKPLVIITEMQIGYTLRLPLDIVKPCNVDLTRRKKGKRTSRKPRSETKRVLPSVIVNPIPAPVTAAKVTRRNKKKVAKTKSTHEEICVEHEILHMCGACEKTFLSSGLVKRHENTCIQMIARNGDVRDDTNHDKKTSYMDLFGMKPANGMRMETTFTGECSNSATVEEVVGVPSRRGRTQRQQVANYFRNNPVPITSSRGRQFLKTTSAGLIGNPGELAISADKACCSTSKSKLRASRHQFRNKVSKKTLLKPHQYVHEYSFGKQARTHRNTELVLGVKSRSFGSLNKCKEFRLCIPALTQDEIARATIRRRVLPYSHKIALNKLCVLLNDLSKSEDGKKLLQAATNKNKQN